jgi:competence protein ComEC
MTPVLLCFAAGVLVLQLQGVLPEAGWTWLASAGVLPVLLPRLRMLALPLAAIAGFCWALGMAHLRLADKLAPELEGRDVEVVGIVSGLPAAGERGQRFEFEPEAVLAPAGAKLPEKLLLSWYRSAPKEAAAADGAVADAILHPGERWRLSLRLRRPHGQVNPHGFDYEAWLMERGVGATGYVRGGRNASTEKLGERNSLLDRVEQLRESVRDRFKRVLGETPAAGILAALAVGDQRAISPEEWRLFSRTGVTHLMSISGLHVTLISGLCAWLASALWRRSPWLTLRLPARKAGAIAAIIGALGYTLVAGFAVPAQRTFWMVTVVALALWSGRISSPARTLALALGVVLMFDPWAVLSAGFWLSFGAVALIFYVAGGRESAPRQWLRVQWAITLGLAPAALFLFSSVSVVGPVANAVAIPVVSAVVTPLALLAALLPWDGFLQLGAWLTEWLLQFLEWCATLPSALWQQHVPPLWSVLVALLGVGWLLAPPGIPWRMTGVALMLPAFALAPSAPAQGEAWITTLDVGQGLAVLVRTANRTLLYDAGPSFGPDADSGERVIAPVVRALGIERLDMLVVTHQDNDHVGGAASVLENFEVGALRSSLPEGHPLLGLAQASHGTIRCAAGEQWTWDGVRFEFLHPAGGSAIARRGNDLSCVLKVTTGSRSMLLTGDIERAAEAELLRRDASALRADVLLMPHHGSRTSSSAEFLAAVAPAAAVAPVGYLNRFGHPNGEVLERYRAANVAVRRTDREGAVTIALAPASVQIHSERQLRRRYWHDAPP